MPDTLVFNTPKRNTEPITIEIDGREMVWTPPKSAILTLPNFDPSATDRDRSKASFDWLGAGLTDEDVAWIIARLKDPADDFDSDQLGPIIDALAEVVAGRRPTT